MTQKSHRILIIISLLLAFWLRWDFSLVVNLWQDEFASILAMQMIRQKGVPILPSGLFYEHGLLYSYLASMLTFFGQTENLSYSYHEDFALWGRMTSLIFGLLTIALAYRFGKRWFSNKVAILTVIALSMAPTAIAWSGRVRMYTLAQFLILLTIMLMLEGIWHDNRWASWFAILTCFLAMFAHFVSVLVLIPLVIAELTFTVKAQNTLKMIREKVMRFITLMGCVIIAFLIKRAGQPTGIEPIQADNAAIGLWDILNIYGHISFDIVNSWQAISPFFLDPPIIIFSIFALFVGVHNILQGMRRGFRTPETMQPAVLFLMIVLFLTTIEMLFFVGESRQDDKYLFILLPVLILLGTHGIVLVSHFQKRGIMFLLALAIIGYSYQHATAFHAKTGSDYGITFDYIRQQWHEDDKILTGTPHAAYYYLGRNDYYAVQPSERYNYRILSGNVERWVGSPWINNLTDLNNVLNNHTVWLVLERWGLLVEYYDSFFRQNILAQTEFIREDNGIILLKSIPNPMLLSEDPAMPAEAILHGVTGDESQLKLLGYTVEKKRLTLYWQAIVSMTKDYTVFVNIQNDNGETINQADHSPLGSIYPTTLWQIGEIVRETSELNLSPGKYHLRVGMYDLDTMERLWVPSDETMQNMIYLGQVTIE
ncbi:MAG: hypothetical protein B6242_03255 [Anaerolineaceae bacterium 4572_78]|nr:MAG: hypothetical protein B6242_03255 [Anaerolineaceae bacterium 4572_78]